MTAVNSNMQIYQIEKFIKIPDRRLISGLLYVNVVNHNDNDAHDDFVQQCYDVDTASSGSIANQIEYSNAFTATDNTLQDFADRGRNNMKHSFADYDTFLFFVAGGMTLSGGAVAPSGLATATGGAALAGLTPAMATTSDGGSTYQWVDTSGTLSSADLGATWYQQRGNPYGDYCCHFIKSHLLARINNASGHDLNNIGGDAAFYKHLPTLTKAWKQDVALSPSAGVPTHSCDGATVVNEHILSHGTYDTTDSEGTALDLQSLVGLGEGNAAGEFEPIDNDAAADIGDDGNTYFSPVDRISIYGKHRFEPKGHTAGSSAVWSTAGTGAIHQQDFWDLVIDVGVRGNNPSGSAGVSTNSSKALFESQVNVAFHPFGETASFDVSDAIH